MMGGYHCNGITLPDNTIYAIVINSYIPLISVNQNERYAVHNLKVNDREYPSIKMSITRGICQGLSVIARDPLKKRINVPIMIAA